MANLSGTHEVDPISRIEGHLGVKVTVDTTGITEANAHGNLWRGFENFLIGRDVNDAITVTQRICGVCPIPHGTASMFTAEHALGISNGMITFATGAPGQASKGVPEKAVLIRNLIYASEFVMSAITHFYHLAALSYVQGPPVPPWTPCYADSQYAPLLVRAGHGIAADGTPGGGVLPYDVGGFSNDLWSAVIKQYVKALRIRRLTFEAGALFAGRMPMTSSFVAGGVTNTINDPNFDAKCDKFRAIFDEIGSFVAREYVPLALALGALYPAYDNVNNAGGLGYGAGCKNLLSWGAFPNVTGGLTGTGMIPTRAAHEVTIQGGFYINGVTATPQIFMSNSDSAINGGAVALVKSSLKEYIARSNYVSSTDWGYAAGAVSAYPGAINRTEPDRTEGTKYSWLKAPRWTYSGVDYPMEVGPFARIVVNGWYPVDGSAIITPLAGIYTNGAALDLRAIHPDLAVALVREGLATASAYTTTGSGDNIRFTSGTATGTIYNFIAGLKGGFSIMDRLRARAIEAFLICQWINGPFDKTQAWNGGSGGWIGQLKGRGAESGFKVYAPPTTAGNEGIGVSEAPRGALAHFCHTDGTKIVQYQCVVPTTWNCSPKDNVGNPSYATRNDAGYGASAVKRGPCEEAMIGVPFDSTPAPGGAVSGIEVLRVAQSFDPCIACAVH